MKYLQPLFALTLACVMAACSNGTREEKGYQISPASRDAESDPDKGLYSDSLEVETRPSGVLLTGVANVRLASLYKVNVNPKDHSTYTGSNEFHHRYEEENDPDNNWHNHLMPGFEAVYGYNLVNISHYDIKERRQKNIFEKPVLVNTLYYPAFSKDTLNKVPVRRNFFMVSVYDEDTNKDGWINFRDLRRFYLFGINGEKQKALIPENYSVFKSEYDPDNDFMFVFAQLDSNENGRRDESEPIHIFWIDLKNPVNTGPK